ncbi:hypothetical protein EZ456_19275 [Pedobacter psychrodurus]|uniref:Uncharacterized protein n=1 Tax=Pedobacter psychrodurus TaxID=2530456 RepID=A0A4R0PKX5_9SPHI|nr:hypothetical protein [Pedobacter psychrodurus]TCD21076.1 hypothetical protein EZ456_19275 [Pedobacter psychrodurus]
MKIKPILIEIAWLLGCAVASYGILVIILGNFGLGISLHDTYFVIKDQYYLIWLSFVLASFPIYFIKESRHSFKRRLPLFIFLILGLGFSSLIIKVSFIFLFLPEIGKNGWTVYPPLSVHNRATTNILPQEGFLSIFLTPINYLILFQITVISLMLFATYKYGKSMNN